MSDYTLDGHTPAAVLTPATPEELGAALREACAAGHAVVPWGGGTRQHLGAPPARYDLALSTLGLNRIAAYHPADLVVTVEAGVTLAALQAELAHHQQWLPWDVPQPAQATIGGLLASGAGGALRLGYGAPRDWTLGMSVALGDGRLVRSGGKVVKNVAGYDAHKLHIGALGTLGVITEATFKLAPIPERRQTVLVAFPEPQLPPQAIEALRAAPLEPLGLVVLNHRAELSIPALGAFLNGRSNRIVVAARFAGTEGAVRRQIREAVRRCVQVGAHTIELDEADDTPLWQALTDFRAPARDGSLLLRAGAPSPTLATMTGLLERVATQAGLAPAQLGIAGVGLVFSRWQVAETAAVVAALAAARSELAALGGYSVVEETPPALASALDRWGSSPDGITVMRSLRAAWDPAGILNPGRYVV